MCIVWELSASCSAALGYEILSHFLKLNLSTLTIESFL